MAILWYLFGWDKLFLVEDMKKMENKKMISAGAFMGNCTFLNWNFLQCGKIKYCTTK